MRMHSESKIAHPVEAVFTAYRDRMAEVAAYLPDIAEINVLDRKVEGSKVALHNEWVSNTDIPKIAKSFIKPEHLRWDDFATWDETTHSCSWRIATRVMTEAVSCSGTTKLVQDGDGTRVVLEGDLEIDGTALPGVPKFMAKKVAPQVEKFIVNMITPNLEKTNEAIEKFLDAQG